MLTLLPGQYLYPFEQYPFSSVASLRLSLLSVLTLLPDSTGDKGGRNDYGFTAILHQSVQEPEAERARLVSHLDPYVPVPFEYPLQ